MPRELSIQDDRPEMGPALSALSAKQQLFVLALFEAPRTHGSGTFAARRAGYGTPASSRASIAQIAYQLSHDPKIQLAISEVSRQYLMTLGPAAIRAVKRLLDNPQHREHGRALGLVLDRVSPTESTATIKIEDHRPPQIQITPELLARIRSIALKVGAEPGPMIEGTAEEVAA